MTVTVRIVSGNAPVVVHGTIATATPGPDSLSRGFERGEMTFGFSLWDETMIAELPMAGILTRDVAIYEDEVLVWRGVPEPWEVDLDAQRGEITAYTKERRFEERFFGWAERENALENGSFDLDDVDPVDWTIEGAVTAEIVPAIAEGDNAVKLTSTSNAGYLWQADPTAFDIEWFPGLLAIMSGWSFIGLGSIVNVGDVIAELKISGPPGTWIEQYKADASIQPGVLFRWSIPLLVAAGVDWLFEGRVRAINGEITHDDLEATFDDATGTEQAGEDLARLVEKVFEYSQTAPWSNLGIVHDCVDSDLIVHRGWEHGDHEVIAEACRQLIREFGCDIWIGPDDVAHFRMKRGRRRDDLAVSIVVTDEEDLEGMKAFARLSGNRISGDPGQGASVVIASGESSAFDADEAGAFDLDLFDGLTIGKWIKGAPSERPIDLSRRARQTLDVEGVPPVLPDVIFPLGAEPLEPGDVVPFEFAMGWAQIATADFRVQSVTTDRRARVQRVKIDLDDGLPFTDAEGS